MFSFDNIYNFFSNILENLYNNDSRISFFTNIVTILSILVPLVLYLTNKLLYLIKLKKFAKTQRPYWLSEEEFYHHTHNYINTRLITSTEKSLTFNKFIRKIIIKSQKQYHLILGESGTGKSTFLINLYYRYNCKLFRHNYNLHYVPLKSPDAIDQIKKIPNPKQCVLLLDAFDEARKSNINAYDFLTEIENNTQYFAKVIITSRNNFFDNDDSVPSTIHLTRILSLNPEKYMKYYIHPFTRKDLWMYIIKKYKLLLHKQWKALIVIHKCGDIVCRPLVISYIDLLIQNNTFYRNTSDVYNEIITNWIKRESYYIASIINAKDISLIEQEMFILVSNVAIFMYNKFPIQQDYYIKIKDLRNIKNADFLEHINGKRSRSLFDRVDDKLIFAHKSILEYLLAINFCKLEFRYEAHMNTLYKFLKEMSKESWNVEYTPLFYVNYGDDSPQIVWEDKNPDQLSVRSVNVPSNRKFIDSMIRWHQKALLFPVFVNGKLYERVNIDLKIQDKHVININNKRDSLTIADDIMRIIKQYVSNRVSVKIVVTTYLIIKSPIL